MRLPPETEAQQKKGGGKKAARKRWREKDGGQKAARKGRRAKGGGQRAAGKGRRAKGGGQRAISAESAPLRGKKRFGRQKSLTKHAKNGKLYHAGFASGPLARARSRGRPPIRLRRSRRTNEFAEMSERPKEHDWKSCVPRKGTEGSNPSLCAKRAPFLRVLFHFISALCGIFHIRFCGIVYSRAYRSRALL